MISLGAIIDFFLHLDKYLDVLIIQYGTWIYGILFAIIFAETGLVATPFLPGDSLLFAVGTIAARGVLDIKLLAILLIAAAIIGDTVNYWIGFHVGPRVFKEKSRFFKKEYLTRTHAFYEKYGGMTIVLARFIPIIRTFAPFVAGIGKMSYGSFLFYNVTGGIVWILSFLFAGYFFGNLPFVQHNLSYIILAIILISILPGVIQYLRERQKAARDLQ